MYSPREDSFLLKSSIEGLKAKRALDMGTGSGIIAKELKKSCKEVIASDIEDCRVEGIEFIKSDLFEKIEGKFDLITWNPPYLPGNRWSDLDCGDGKIILRFFTEAKKHLQKNGKILIVLSSLSPVGEKEIEELGYRTKVIEREKLAFEEIYVLEAAVI